MQNPFDGFQQGLMTGAQLGGRMRENRQRREIGGMVASGDYSGASRTAFESGDLQGGAALAGQARSGQIVGALRTGDFDGAMSFASTPQELAAVQQFKATASEQEREQAVMQATNLAAVIESIQGLPPEQQLAAAQQAAPQFGVDPAQITPDTLQRLPALRIQALGLKDYLGFQQEERAAQRPIIGNGFISLPPGSQVPQGAGGQPQTLGSTLPPGWTPQPRPNQAPSAPAAGGAERNQPVSVSFRSSHEAQGAIRSLVPGVTFTSGDRTAKHNRDVGGVPTSNHVRGRAWDLVPPSGMSMGQLAAKMRQSGFRALNEGDHIHVSW